MFLLSKPSTTFVEHCIASQKSQKFSYPDVGASRSSAPSGYNVDHNRIQLGHGPSIFARAKAALREWKMFDIPWVQLYSPAVPLEVGENVGVVVRHLGFWSINGCRIVYLLDGDGPLQRYGFAYGTLRDHAERGEERFSVECLPDESVWYDVYAFSRPGFWARLGYPVTRGMQRRFASESMLAMKRAVNNS